MRAASAPRCSPARSPVSRFERPCFPRSALLVVVRASLPVGRRALWVPATVTYLMLSFVFRCARRDSDPQPAVPKTAALGPMFNTWLQTRAAEATRATEKTSPPARRLTPAKAIRVYLFDR